MHSLFALHKIDLPHLYVVVFFPIAFLEQRTNSTFFFSYNHLRALALPCVRISMVKRKQRVQEEKVIHDLSDLVEFNVAKILYDGGKRKRANLYLVKVRAITGGKTTKARKATQTTTATSASKSRLCVLKIVRKHSSFLAIPNLLEIPEA